MTAANPHNRNHGMSVKQMPQNDTPDLEAIRRLAVELLLNYGHHEVAIDSPFMAETYVHDMGQKLIDLVGWPIGWKKIQ